MKTSRNIGFIIAITSAVLYGLMPLLTKTIYQSGANSFTVAFLRFLLGTAIFYLMHRLTSKTPIGVSRKELRQLLVCAIGYGFTPVLLYTSYNYLASGLATTIHFVYPVFVVIGSVLFRIETLSRKKVICCLLCMVGIIAFYTPGGDISIAGILIALASGIVYAFYTVYLAASDLLEMEPYKLSFWKHLLAVAIVGICAAIFRKFQLPAGMNGWTFTFLLAILAATASYLYQQAAKFAGAQNTAMLSTFEPLTSVIVGYFVYAEPLTGRNILGILCILTSVILLSIPGREQK